MDSTEADKPRSNSLVGEQLEQFLPSDHKPWYKKGYLIRLNLIASSLVLFSSSNGYDGSLMNNLQALSQWSTFMSNPAGAWLGWINGIYWVGCFIGYPCGAFIGNKWGRKPAVYVGYVLLILGVALQTAASNEAAFIMARFFLGGASAFFGSTTPLLLNETAYPTQRATWNALFMSGWYVGGTVAAWVTFATRTYSSSWAWRLPSLVQGLVPLIALPGFLLSEESPRWLISVGRKEEARVILANYHAGGDASSPLVNYEMIEISTAIEAEQEAHDSSSYLEMIKTPGNRRRLLCSVTLGIFAQWAGNGVISYYLSLILDSIGVTSTEDQTLISACLQMWNLIFSIIAGILVDRAGRRPLFLSSAAIMFVGYVLVTGLSGAFENSGKSGVGAAVIPFLFIFFAGYDIALTPFITAYPCEIWTFRLRSRGLTITWLSSIIAIFFNTFVNPIALAAIGWKYYFVFLAVLIAFGFTAYFFYPETKGYSLEQVAIVFDGDDAEVGDPSTMVAESLAVEKNAVTHHEEA